jgi:hypothetical protein
MPMTEDDLRTALRGIPTDLPTAPDRLRGVEARVRRHRRRVVATVAGAVVVVLLAVPLVRLVSEDRQRDALPVGTSEQQVRDAMMQYAAFVTYWDGQAYNGKLGTDPGVEGVVVTTSLPPTSCTIASSAPGEPGGTQAAWALGSGSVIPTGGEALPTPDVALVVLLWQPGVTACDPRPGSAQLMAAPPAAGAGRIASDVVGAQRLDDPSRPALDVAAVYHRIPDDRLTQHGRDVFAAYQTWRDGLDLGSATEQNVRVLIALTTWAQAAIDPATPVTATGPTVLHPSDYAGEAAVPAGYSVHRDGAAVCVDGRIFGSPLQHLDRSSFTDPNVAPTVYDGPCPTA